MARHGETDWNAARRLQGSQDTPLNERGRQQAIEMGRELDGIPFQHVYTSLQKRSIESAAPLLTRLNAPTTRLVELNEQGLGAFEGHYMDGREPAIAETYLRRLSNHDDDLDGGESVNAHLERVTRGLQGILSNYPVGLILVVAHGATNAAILRALFGLTFEESRAQKSKNCEVRVVDVDLAGKGVGWRRWNGDDWRRDLFPEALPTG